MLKINGRHKALLWREMWILLISSSLVIYSQGSQTEEEDGHFSQQDPKPRLTQQTYKNRDELRLET